MFAIEDKFLEIASEAIKIVEEDETYSSLVRKSLKSLSKIDGVKSIAVFNISKETFEFKHYMSLPEESERSAQNAFDILVEEGAIGEALEEGNYKICEKKINGFYYVAIPLMKPDGPLGIALAAFDKNANELNSATPRFLFFLSRVYSFKIAYFSLLDEYKKTKEMVDQQVALRTMKLVETQKKMAEQFESLQSNLSMSIPHEIRTPINQILGFADFLTKYFETVEKDEARDMLSDIRDSALRLKELFENYIYYANLSLISTNVYEIMNLQQKVTLSAQTAIYDAVASKAMQAGREEDIDIQVEEARLAIDEGYLRKLIEELVSNALKYSEKGTIVTIRGEKIDFYEPIEGPAMKITIKDRGIGMEREQIENIRAYMQFDRKIREQQGSGLGLSIAQRIVDLHNGEFTIKSEVGKYTEITVVLPIAKEAV